MLEQLDLLLPGYVESGTAWSGHHLPLSGWRWDQPDGPVLLAGDAAGLVNPMTGEGIYYAVATGMLAGRAAARALAAGTPASAGVATGPTCVAAWRGTSSTRGRPPSSPAAPPSSTQASPRRLATARSSTTSSTSGSETAGSPLGSRPASPAR